MSIAEQIYEVVKPLPEPLALEALHFIEYLSSKTADRAEMTDLTDAQETVMKHVWDNQDDEVWNDVKTL
jgi:energy-converting hydrogenase A subunit M